MEASKVSQKKKKESRRGNRDHKSRLESHLDRLSTGNVDNLKDAQVLCMCHQLYVKEF